jgi:hypothetical protein
MTFTIEQTAEMLALSIQTVTAYVTRGDLEHDGGGITNRSIIVYLDKRIPNRAEIMSAAEWDGWEVPTKFAHNAKPLQMREVLSHRATCPNRAEIGRRMGLTHERIRRIEADALRIWKEKRDI